MLAEIIMTILKMFSLLVTLNLCVSASLVGLDVVSHDLVFQGSRDDKRLYLFGNNWILNSYQTSDRGFEPQFSSNGLTESEILKIALTNLTKNLKTVIDAINQTPNSTNYMKNPQIQNNYKELHKLAIGDVNSPGINDPKKLSSTDISEKFKIIVNKFVEDTYGDPEMRQKAKKDILGVFTEMVDKNKSENFNRPLQKGNAANDQSIEDAAYNRFKNELLSDIKKAEWIGMNKMIFRMVIPLVKTNGHII